MNLHWTASRRGLFRRALGLWLLSRVEVSKAGNAAGSLDRLAKADASATRVVHARRYRVRAAVNLFGIPLISKDGVGGGRAMVEELTSGSSRTAVLQFSGGSWPDHLKGFNRFGMTQEAVREQAGIVAESAYFSFMTSSPEKNSDEAWRAFNDRSRQLGIAVARGDANPEGYRCSIDHEIAPAACTWLDCPKLMDDLRSRSGGSNGMGPNIRAERAFPTFLYVVRRIMSGNAAGSGESFIHNATVYQLTFQMEKVTGGATLLTGHIFERGTRDHSQFRVWFDPSDPALLPSRIEFRPRSFLCLIFEHDPKAGGPSLHPLTPGAEPEETT